MFMVNVGKIIHTWKMFYAYELGHSAGNEETYPTKNGKFGKIIDFKSAKREGRGYVSYKEGICMPI